MAADITKEENIKVIGVLWNFVLMTFMLENEQTEWHRTVNETAEILGWCNFRRKKESEECMCNFYMVNVYKELKLKSMWYKLVISLYKVLITRKILL